MKPFRFRLESLLTIRLREEDKKKEAMAYAVDRLAHADRAVANGQAALDAIDQKLTEQRTTRMNCRDHLLMLHSMDLQRTECARLANVRRQSAAEVESKREDLAEARRQREIVTRLKEKQLAEHQAEVARKEELEISDMIGARHAMSRAEQLLTGAAG